MGGNNENLRSLYPFKMPATLQDEVAIYLALVFNGFLFYFGDERKTS